MSSEKEDRCLYYSIVQKVILQKKKKKEKKISISLAFFGSFIIVGERSAEVVRRRAEGFRVAEVRYRE